MTLTCAPDLIAVRTSEHADYPVEIVVGDHELGNIVLKLTGAVARIVYHDLRSALVNSGQREQPYPARPISSGRRVHVPGCKSDMGGYCASGCGWVPH